MAEKLTKQQMQVVTDRGGRLLVSAAAGSGKTKVLVDRLLLYITESNGQINIDDFLIITYTQAAAAELRSKIAEKLNERLTQDPGNKHLQRQVQRLYMAKISTVHAFCGDILREYAFQLDIPADFRVADDNESSILKAEVLDRLLESSYLDSDPDFLFFMDSQEYKRSDYAIPGLILKVHKNAWCHIDPEGWLDKCLISNALSGVTDVSEVIWGQVLIEDLKQFLNWNAELIENCAKRVDENGSMPSVAALLRDDKWAITSLCQYQTWDEIYAHKKIQYGKIGKPKSCNDPDLYEYVRDFRTEFKNKINDKLDVFSFDSKQLLEDLQKCSASMIGLVKLVKTFADEYSKAKRARHIMDFDDLEHKVLDLLYGKKRNGVTKVAEEIGSRFVEIMVDEYQDTNEVQDSIFAALTRIRKNLFMVGDVKQAIYQFRLADPTIFLSKYDTFTPAEVAEPGQDRKIMLSHNFRSAGPVIDAVNDVFSSAMSREVGGLIYDKDAQLYEGIPHISVPETEIELCAIDVQADTYAEEAKYTAERISQLLDGTHMVRDGEQLRPIVADDIVILLRAPKSSGAEYQFALAQRGIRASSESSVDILQTEEVSFLYSFLQIIDNPLQDIPLIATLSSKIFKFSADDLAAIRSDNPRTLFFDSLRASENEKAVSFMKLLNELRQEAKLCTASQLLEKVLAATRMDAIYASFDDGAIRKANILYFCQTAQKCESTGIYELSQFLNYLSNVAVDGLKITSNQRVPGAVTIMSIHKSKGLEFPVVFLCGLSRQFNFQSLNNAVLCHQDLGIGMNLLDTEKRIRYPSIMKTAIRLRLRKDMISEEIRLLYVAMTRAKDRLIMTYADNKLENTIADLVDGLDLYNWDHLSSRITQPGDWIMLAALKRTEAGALFKLGGNPKVTSGSSYPWDIRVEQVALIGQEGETLFDEQDSKNDQIDFEILKNSLRFAYPHLAATTFPSKQTATQLKGRSLDKEAAENAPPPRPIVSQWRDAAFQSNAKDTATAFGNVMHTVMEHISYEKCDSVPSIRGEIERIVNEGYLDPSDLQKIDCNMLCQFFTSELGVKIRGSANVLREFKFSVLDDASRYGEGMEGDAVLLQGVVDCAIIEDDGITIIDFKTDKVTSETVNSIAEQYRGQVSAYAQAMAKIYNCNIKSAVLYFFRTGSIVSVI